MICRKQGEYTIIIAFNKINIRSTLDSILILLDPGLNFFTVVHSHDFIVLYNSIQEVCFITLSVFLQIMQCLLLMKGTVCARKGDQQFLQGNKLLL